jgi:hypothetical protein
MARTSRFESQTNARRAQSLDDVAKTEHSNGLPTDFLLVATTCGCARVLLCSWTKVDERGAVVRAAGPCRLPDGSPSAGMVS